MLSVVTEPPDCTQLIVQGKYVLTMFFDITREPMTSLYNIDHILFYRYRWRDACFSIFYIFYN